MKKNTSERKPKSKITQEPSTVRESKNFVPPPFTALSKIQWEENKLHTITHNALLYKYFTQYLSIYSPSAQEIFKIFKELLEFEKGSDFTKDEMEKYASHLLSNLGRQEKKDNISSNMFVEERLEHETMLEEFVTKFMATMRVV